MADIENNEEVKAKVEHPKSRYTALILCWFLGFLGVHRMYAGKVASGISILYGTIFSACMLFINVYLGLVSFVVVGTFVVNDFLRIATKTFKDGYGKYIEEDNI